jgi:hypothetical protein
MKNTDVDNNPVCKEHEPHERMMFCNEHRIWICDVCLKNHKKCKGGTLHYTEINELIEKGNIKQSHADLQRLSNDLTNCLSRTKNEFINIIDDYQTNLSKSLNLNIDYNNKNHLQLAMQCFRYKQTNEELEYDLFYNHLVNFIKDLEKSKELFIDYKIIVEQDGFINRKNIDLLRKWTNTPKLNVELVFRASRDGFKAMEFHSKCENISPSIVIAKTEYGKIIGGYTGLEWKVATKEHEIKGDPSSFIFSFDLKERYLPKDPKYCISHSINSGPIFGCSYSKNYGPMLSTSYLPDFEIINECNVKKCEHFEIGNNYNYSGTKEEFFGNDGPFKIEDYELYRIIV